LSKLIGKSKEAKEWDLEFNLEPDRIEAKILSKPSIIDPYTTAAPPLKSLEDTSILRSIVHEPINFKKWAIFCIDKDAENAKYLQDKFYGISQSRGLQIEVEFADIVKLHSKA
jgi:hypothetical protein